MMKFRRLYWVTESVAPDGASEITGVFTSVPDLLEDFVDVLMSRDDKRENFRVSLVELDVFGKPLGVWNKPEMAELKNDLEPLVKSGEFTRDEVIRLTEALGSIQ